MRKNNIPPEIIQFIIAFSKLSNVQISILIRRYATIPPLTQKEVGAILKLSNERIRQLEEEALNIIYKKLMEIK